MPVKTAQPEKMVDELKAIFASDKEGPLKGRVRFIANTRLGAILVVTSQPGYLPRAQSCAILTLAVLVSSTEMRRI